LISAVILENGDQPRNFDLRIKVLFSRVRAPCGPEKGTRISHLEARGAADLKLEA